MTSFRDLTESDINAHNERVAAGRRSLKSSQNRGQAKSGVTIPENSPTGTSDAFMGVSGRQPHRKYRNQPCVVDGLKFDSKKEAQRWQELSLWQKAGAIKNLRRQVEFKLDVKGQYICSYFGDFAYESESDGWALVVEDVKSKATRELPVYRLKAKLMLAIYGVEIREA